MHTRSIETFQHQHVFLGVHHARNERRTWAVIILCGTMMVAELAGGTLFGSMALVADGFHMSTHAAALLIAALAYTFARRHARDARFVFGTGKMGDLAGFTSAIVLGMIALLIGAESVSRLVHPVPIALYQAILVAALGLGVNVLSAVLLREAPHDHQGGTHRHQVGGDAIDSACEHEHQGGHRHHGHDWNLRAAYIHVMADAAVSILAVLGLSAGLLFGWVWMDPVMGIVGALVIGSWAWNLVRAAGAVLLDVQLDPALQAEVLRRLEEGTDRVSDLHLWRVGPGHTAAVASIVSDTPCAPGVYKARLAGVPGLSHVTVEVEPCPTGHEH